MLPKAREGAAAGIAGRGSHQRVETYIVISNPKRMSTNSGFVQAIVHSKQGIEAGWLRCHIATMAWHDLPDKREIAFMIFMRSSRLAGPPATVGSCVTIAVFRYPPSAP